MRYALKRLLDGRKPTDDHEPISARPELWLSLGLKLHSLKERYPLMGSRQHCSIFISFFQFQQLHLPLKRQEWELGRTDVLEMCKLLFR